MYAPQILKLGTQPRTILTIGFLALISWMTLPGNPPGRISKVKAAVLNPSAPKRASEHYRHLPLGFEANHGQADSRVQFLARGTHAQLYLTSTEAVFRLRIADCGLRIGSSSHK